jgi:ABC-2 type transport system ATP-binding protein
VIDSTQPLLRVIEAEKAYRDVQALRGMSFDLYAGELLGLLGPNGAGKTTLIRCLAGRSRLDAGEIRFGSTLRQRRLLGVVPQTLAIYEDLTARQNLTIFGRLHGVRGAKLERRVDEALAWSNLGERQHQLASTFSGGMKRRLNIACAVLHEPRILLLDEPTVGVDPQSRERIYEMLVELQQQGTAILLTTHQLDEAQFRCSRIAIVDAGRVVQSGSFDELVQHTIGADQQLTVRFQAQMQTVPAPFRLAPDGVTASARITHVAAQLPRILDAMQTAGCEIEQVVLQSPTLQQVFLHLTGKELRE